MGAPATPSIALMKGDVVLHRPDGGVDTLLRGGVEELALSPKGNLAVAIRLEPARGGDERSAIYLIDSLSGKVERLVAPRSSHDLRRTLERPRHPCFSEDGKVVFFAVDAWVTTAAIHRIDVESRKERFLIDGNSNDLITVGRWRGDLLVWRHLYRRGMASDLAQVVSPEGVILTTVPGSEGPDGEAMVERWLRRQAR
jgi:hypothetical protein